MLTRPTGLAGATSPNKPAAFVAVEGEHLVLEIRHEQVRAARPIVVGGIHAHRAARHAVVGERDAGGHGRVGERAVAVVVEELIGLRVVGDKQVHPPVAVVVDKPDAERLGAGVGDAGLLADVGEAACAQVAEQLRRHARIDLGRAVRLVLAVERAALVGGLGPLHVVGDEQVEPAVAVVVHKRRAGAEVGVDDAGGPGDVGELEGAVVAIQPIALERRDVEVLVAVVVDIACRDAHPVDRLVEAAALDDVGERAVAIVAVEPVDRCRRRPSAPSRGR